jgi:signal peptidase II
VATKVLVVAELEGRRVVELLGGELYLSVSRQQRRGLLLRPGRHAAVHHGRIVVVVVILRISGRLRSAGWALSLGLLLGGASGNLVDRLFRSPGPGRGAVVDWIALGWFPSFNVADSGIVVGGMLAVLLSFRGIDVDGSRAGPEHLPHDGQVSSRRSLPVPEGLDGLRLDAAISRLFGLSRTGAADLVGSGAVTLDGQAVLKSERVTPAPCSRSTCRSPSAVPSRRRSWSRAWQCCTRTTT